MTEAVKRIAENVSAVRDKMAQAAARSGRTSDDIQLVAVTKYVDATLSRFLVESGCADLGESRPQQLWEKVELLHGLPVRWHLIGHLQRNKLQRTLPHLTLIHSLDSLRLAKAIDVWAAQQMVRVRALVEVNISTDASKHGFTAQDLPSALRQMSELSNLELLGLMGMASRVGGEKVARQNFQNLRQLRDDFLTQSWVPRSFRHLSMGMSGDYEVAIEEGASIVRVGSALFEGVTT